MRPYIKMHSCRIPHNLQREPCSKPADPVTLISVAGSGCSVNPGQNTLHCFGAFCHITRYTNFEQNPFRLGHEKSPASSKNYNCVRKNLAIEQSTCHQTAS